MGTILLDCQVYGIAFFEDAKNSRGKRLSEMWNHPVLKTNRVRLVSDYGRSRQRYILASAETVEAEISLETDPRSLSFSPFSLQKEDEFLRIWDIRLQRCCEDLNINYTTPSWLSYSFTRG